MSSNLQISETQKKYTESKNAFRLYKDLIVGDNSGIGVRAEIGGELQ